MTTLTAQVPDALYREVVRLADQESISIDQFVAMALSAQLSAWAAKQHLERRAERGDWATFEEVLKKVPDPDPEEHDRLDF